MIAPPECIILLVDDEALTRQLAEMLLEECGYRVVTAENASQAMHRLQTHPDVGLIFTDLLMPGPMDGRELIHHLRCDGCDLPAILTSGIGYAPPFLPTRTRFLNKPYKRAHLVSHIEQFIAA